MVKLVLFYDILLNVAVSKNLSEILSEDLYFTVLIFRGCSTFPVIEYLHSPSRTLPFLGLRFLRRQMNNHISFHEVRSRTDGISLRGVLDYSMGNLGWKLRFSEYPPWVVLGLS